MVEKLDMSSKDITQENIKKIQALFPNAVTEIIKDSKIKLAIDFDVLKQELSSEIIDDKQERYQMTWPEKKKASLLANTSINSTLRPLINKSLEFDNTNNIYIEGDNLEVLKLIRETYLNRIKLIYIDPPYNTTDDLIYNDNYHLAEDEFKKMSGDYDELGNRLYENKSSNPRYHTVWLNEMYSRIKVARDLLKDDGAIFISINDIELSNLIKICDDIFMNSNMIAIIPRLSSAQRPAQEKYISIQHDYIVVYAKNSMNPNSMFYKTVVRNDLENVKRDSIGLYFENDTSPILASSTQGYSSGGDYDFEFEGKIYKPVDKNGNRRRWLWTKSRMEAAAKLGILYPTKNGLRVKNYIDKEFQLNTNIMVDKDINLILASYDFMNAKFANKNGTNLLEKLGINFSFSKPVELIKEIIKLSCKGEDIVLDFFSGSATTAQAVFELNHEFQSNIKFILVQIPELIKDSDLAYKQGFKYISDIGEERIRKCGLKIKEEYPLTTKKLDIGFRVFKLDSSNMNEVYYNPSNVSQTLLDSTIDNIKSDRTDLDLLFQVMLELGVELSAKIEEVNINGIKYYKVNDDDIIACFDSKVTNDVIVEIAQLNPLYAVFKNTAFVSDSVGINNEQIFKTYSPSTKIKIL